MSCRICKIFLFEIAFITRTKNVSACIFILANDLYTSLVISNDYLKFLDISMAAAIQKGLRAFQLSSVYDPS